MKQRITSAGAVAGHSADLGVFKQAELDICAWQEVGEWGKCVVKEWFDIFICLARERVPGVERGQGVTMSKQVSTPGCDILRAK